MKLHTISESDLTKAAQKLNDQVVKIGAAELRHLVRDPHHTVDLIRRGMTAKKFALADRAWTTDFLEQWALLDEDTLDTIFTAIYHEMIARIEKLRTEDLLFLASVLNEKVYSQFNPPIPPVLSGAGKFIAKLAKLAFLLMKLLIASRGGAGNLNPKSLEDLRVLNPYAVYRLTKDLQAASAKVLRAKKQQQAKQNAVKIRKQGQRQPQNVP